MTDAVVVGSGPNGLAAALTLARAGLEVEIYEGYSTPGGGCRTEALTLPGYLHDVCSAVHPLLSASRFFRSLDLEAAGIRLREPPIAFAHPLEDGRAAGVGRSVDATAETLGGDAARYRRMLGPLVHDQERIIPSLLAPLRRPPAHPLSLARLVGPGLLPVTWLARRFETEQARGLLAGAAAHSMLALDRPLTSSYALMFALMAHSSGWPIVEGGSARIIDALVHELETLGARIVTGRWVRSLEELPPSRLVLLDVAPRTVLELTGPRLSPRYRRALRRFRQGPGICKVDYALSQPVPWRAAICAAAGTVHLGGRLEEVARSEAEVAAGRHAERPFCLVVQPGVVDPSRAPAGGHTLWAYCHVPSGSSLDVAGRIEAQIERFAPGFKDTVLERVTRTAAEFERYNPNCVGGDVSGGLPDLRQTLARPTLQWDPYRTPLEGVYLCSASTPPGGGVHGLCGYFAARSALSHLGIAADRLA